MITLIFSITLLAGIIICCICDIAISGGLTWSLISGSSIAFAWVVSFPCIRLRKNRIAASLISLSIFVIPYLYLLSCLLKTKEVFSIGAVMSAISIVFLWLIFAVFRCIGKKTSTAVGLSFLLGIPFLFVVNIMLSKMISEPICDAWDIVSMLVLLLSALISFAFGNKKEKC